MVDLLALGHHEKRFAANRKSSTDPDVATTAVMLRALYLAVDSTMAKRPAAAAVCFARPFLDFDCFLAAMMNPLGGSGCKRGLTLTPPVEVDLRSCATIA
jgi:hypothetical protein